MNESQILLNLALKEVGVPVSVDSFDERLICQKAVCIIQEAGVPLGYFFNWYIKGPYSSSLADDVFGIAAFGEEADSVLSRWSLGEKTRVKMAPLKELFAELPDNPKENARTLELWASLLFLKRTRQIDAGNMESIQKILKANDKHYEDEAVRSAVAILRKHGLPL